MKQNLKVRMLLLCACVLLFLTGCQREPLPSTSPTETSTQPLLTAQEKYDAARQKLEGASNWILDYSLEQKRQVGADTYTNTAAGKASFSKLYDRDMVAVVEEQLTHGGYSGTYLEVYCEGMAYSQVNNSTFQADMTPGVFVQRHLPAALLDSSLYRTIQEAVGDNTTLITFEDGIGVEKWLNRADAKLVAASGTAILDSDGTLRETTCNITYTLGKVQYTFRACVRATAPASLDLAATHQEHIKGSSKIEDLDVPKLLFQAVGDVYAAGKLNILAQESIFSEAIPLTYSQKSVFDLQGKGDALYARAEYDILYSDYRGEASSSKQLDLFENGVFSTAKNDGKPQINASVTAEQVRAHCEDAILSALAAPKYVKSVSVTQEKDSIRLELEGNDAFVKDMMGTIQSFLQVDLDAKATDQKTLSAGGYVVIDRETGLPTAMGLNLERQHTIDTVTYDLTYTLEQTMHLSDNG